MWKQLHRIRTSKGLISQTHSQIYTWLYSKYLYSDYPWMDSSGGSLYTSKDSISSEATFQRRS